MGPEKLGIAQKFRPRLGKVSETDCAALAPRWHWMRGRRAHVELATEPRVVLDATQVRDMAVREQPERRYQNEYIFRTISRCREHVTRLCWRLTDARRSKAATVMGGEAFLRRCATVPSYTKRMLWDGK